MRTTVWMLAVLSAAGAVAAAPGVEPKGAPAVAAAMAGDISLTVQRVTFQRSASLTFGASENPLPGKREETAQVSLELAVRSRHPEALDRLLTGAPSRRTSIRAADERGKASSSGSSEVAVTPDGLQLRVTVNGVSPRATSLASLQGELFAVQKARRIRFHVPWLKDETPLRVEVDGGTATLKRFQLVGADSTLWISVRPPEGYHVAPFEQKGAVAANAVDIDGNFVNGGAITDTSQTLAGAEPEFRFFAPMVRRTPSRLMLDVLCVAGDTESIPFTLKGIRIPGIER